ncbi:TPA: diacylglycerol kinase [Vibrio parahaemolyticus]|nr:diacylglycerol kinase [Vibrio parahaemolyticus]
MKGKNSILNFNRVLSAFIYSCKGLRSAYQSEAAIRQELVVIAALSFTLFFIDTTTVEMILMLGSLVLIFIVELINSAIEAVVDRIGIEHHQLSGKAKDIGSASVMVSMFLSAFVWLSILF